MRVHFSLTENGRISGRIVLADGTPVADTWIGLVPLRAAADQDTPRESSHTSTTAVTGVYQIDGVPPGKYHLVVNADDGPSLRAPFLRQFYPGVADEARATVIELGVGEAREGLDFTLTPLRESAINGVVVDENEHPRLGGVSLSAHAGQQVEGGDIDNERRGRAVSPAGLDRQTYLLTAGGPLWSRREMTVTVGDDVAFVRVVLRPRGT